MSVGSIWFLLFAALLAVIYDLCAQRAVRQALLTAVNVGFLVPLVPNASSWGVFALVVVGTYVLARLAKSRPSGWFVLATIVVAVAAFAVLKHYAFLQGLLPDSLWNHPIELVGISYMLFKFIHVLVDGWQGQLGPLDFATYANYQLAFFTLLAGPIQRYNDFQRFWSQMDSAPATTRDTLLVWNRILTGLVKIGPVAALSWYVFDQAGQRFDPLRTQYPLLWFLVYMYAYPVYLYFNFSGYTDIVIGAARLLGFELPENFDRPYLARNIPDFWNRWHISLTHWIRDYVFMTSYKSVAERFPATAKYLGWFLLFWALFLAGVWHGSTGGFAIFGALNGLGAAWAQIYGDVLKKLLGRSGFQAYLRNRAIYVIAVCLTLSFEAFSLVFFSSGVEKALHLMHVAVTEDHWLIVSSATLRSLALKAALVGVPALAVLLAGIYWQRAAIRRGWNAIGNRLFGRLGSLYTWVLCKTVLVTVVFLFSWAINESDPIVVYMRF